MTIEILQNNTKYIDELEAVFAKELTPELANFYVDSFVKKLGGSNLSTGEFIEKGSELHFQLGKELYGPLLVGFSQWIADKAERLSYSGPVYFALRDAAPLKAAADVMWNGKSIYSLGVYANRPLLGIEDEIASEWSNVNGEMISYLKSLGIGGENKILWVDSGAWGTVIKTMKQNFLKKQEFYPFFWYSHNPNIPAYLNELAEATGVKKKYGEILNDSLECVFPQLHARPLEVFSKSGHWQVKLNSSSYLSQKWGEAALAGVAKCANQKFFNGGVSQNEESEALNKLVLLSDKAKESGEWTGVLPVNTPTWSKGEEFLASWPENLLP